MDRARKAPRRNAEVAHGPRGAEEVRRQDHDGGERAGRRGYPARYQVRDCRSQGGSEVVQVEAEVPRALKPLLRPARYKAAHGGRGGAKSHFFAEQLVARCAQQPTRAACIREVQNSLKESVKQLLVDKIAKLG